VDELGRITVGARKEATAVGVDAVAAGEAACPILRRQYGLHRDQFNPRRSHRFTPRNKRKFASMGYHTTERPGFERNCSLFYCVQEERCAVILHASTRTGTQTRLRRDLLSEGARRATIGRSLFPYLIRYTEGKRSPAAGVVLFS